MYSSLKCGRLLLCFCCFNPSLYIFLLKPFPRLYERFNFIFKKDMIARTLWCLLDLPHRRLFLINLIDYIYFFFSSLHHPPAVSISYFFFTSCICMMCIKCWESRKAIFYLYIFWKTPPTDGSYAHTTCRFLSCRSSMKRTCIMCSFFFFCYCFYAIRFLSKHTQETCKKKANRKIPKRNFTRIS